MGGEQVPWKNFWHTKIKDLRVFKRKRIPVSATKRYLSPPRLQWAEQYLVHGIGTLHRHSASAQYLRLRLSTIFPGPLLCGNDEKSPLTAQVSTNTKRSQMIRPAADLGLHPYINTRTPQHPWFCA